MNELLTTRLNHWGNNTLVLAKKYDGKPIAVTYSNKTQAQKRIDTLKSQGVDCYLYGNYPFYVAMKES
jgi:hypothetical protein